MSLDSEHSYHELAFCPFCNQESSQQVKHVLYYGMNLRTGLYAKICLLCGEASGWKNGVMLYPRTIPAHARRA